MTVIYDDSKDIQEIIRALKALGFSKADARQIIQLAKGATDNALKMYADTIDWPNQKPEVAKMAFGVGIQLLLKHLGHAGYATTGGLL